VGNKNAAHGRIFIAYAFRLTLFFAVMLQSLGIFYNGQINA
jgi:hypothetical protein